MIDWARESQIVILEHYSLSTGKELGSLNKCNLTEVSELQCHLEYIGYKEFPGFQT